MRVLVAGGTGFVGQELLKQLIAQKHTVSVLTRSPKTYEAAWPNIKFLQWNGKSLGDWARVLPEVDAVINLCGEPIVAKRWSEAQKKKIVESRTDATQALVSAIEKSSKKPSVMVNASAIGFYGNVPMGDVREDWEKGNGFLADTCDVWERTAQSVKAFGVRLVIVRIGIVLGDNGGALQKMLFPFKLGLGGPLGSGDQWMSWVHRTDLVRLFLFAIENEQVKGVLNGTAPHAVTMKEFCQCLGKALHRPSWLPAPGFAVKLLLGEMACVLLEGQKVIPAAASKYGFRFKFAEVQGALRDILTSKGQ